MAIREIFSFNTIVSRMTAKMSTLTSISDFTPGSVIRTMFEVVAIFVEYLQFLVEAAFNSFYLDTAEEDDLDNRVEDFGMERRAAVAASGTITFISDTAADETFYIYAGTTVATEPDVFGNTISYELYDDVTFVSGATTATGVVVCTITGTGGNVASGEITNIPTTISGIDSITNYAAFTNGSSEETDDQLRKRVPIHLNGLQMGNEDGIKSAIFEIEGVTLVRLEENSPSNGYVTAYVSTESGSLTQEQLDDVEAALAAAVSFGVETSIVTPTIEYITITLDAEIDTVNYDEAFVKAEIQDLIDEKVRTNPESTLQIYDLILASTVQGVENIRNMKINGSASDYTVSGFKVVRINDKTVDITITTI